MDDLFPSADDIFPSSRAVPQDSPPGETEGDEGAADTFEGAAGEDPSVAPSTTPIPEIPRHCPTLANNPQTSPHAPSTNRFTLDQIIGDAVKMPPELVLVPRQDWRAKPVRPGRPKNHPSCIVMFTYATDTRSCSEPEACEKMVRKIQRDYIKYSNTDIPYNFLVGGDGRVYEGRGWHLEPDVDNYYRQLHGHILQIAFIGNYRVKRPSDEMFDAALELMDYGRNNFRLDNNFGFVENFY